MNISIIAALSRNRVIGKNNDLPWHLPDDMKFFMQKTKGHVIIMGRRNYQSIPEKFRPLPNRINIVITRQRNFSAPSCYVAHSIDDAIEMAKGFSKDEIFLIGGSEVYAEGITRCNRMYLTEIRAEVNGDVFFPDYDVTKWKEISREFHPTDNRHLYAFDFVQYDRIRS